MFENILEEMQDKIRELEYVMTFHAEEEMNNDLFTIFDVENGILTGEIVERQKDSITNQWKYCIVGESEQGDEIEVIAQISPTGKLVIITVFRL